MAASQGVLKPVKPHPVKHKQEGVTELQNYARKLYAKDEIQVSCLFTLWTMESHWNYRAKGSRTSQGRAYGIAQALPANKMSTISADYLTNPKTQIKWGLLYIKTRYNNRACWALKHEFDKGWY